MTYRGYEIQHNYKSGVGAWTFYHEDYDGPGDTRSGWAYTLREAKAQIDEQVEEAG